MSDLAARLTLAADDLATMRSELAAESDFEVFGGGAAAELAAHLTGAWRSQHDRLDRLGRSLSELAADVRLAAQRYDAADAQAAGAFVTTLSFIPDLAAPAVYAHGDAQGGAGAPGEAGAEWTP